MADTASLRCGAHGGVAQLGERLPCKQEVMGSTPTISTKSKLGKTSFAYGLIAQLARALG